jgi:hypothetical protein
MSATLKEILFSLRILVPISFVSITILSPVNSVRRSTTPLSEASLKLSVYRICNFFLIAFVSRLSPITARATDFHVVRVLSGDLQMSRNKGEWL